MAHKGNMSLLALVAALATCFGVAFASKGWIENCCPKYRPICCHGKCIPRRHVCPIFPKPHSVSSASCCKPPPPPDCCPKGTFCCGTSCVKEEDRPHVKCKIPGECSASACEPKDPCKQEPFLNPQTCKPIELVRWSFNQKSGKCEAFSWTQCGKNENHFETKEECQKTCGHVIDDCCPKGYHCCGNHCRKDSAVSFGRKCPKSSNCCRHLP